MQQNNIDNNNTSSHKKKHKNKYKYKQKRRSSKVEQQNGQYQQQQQNNDYGYDFDDDEESYSHVDDHGIPNPKDLIYHEEEEEDENDEGIQKEEDDNDNDNDNDDDNNEEAVVVVAAAEAFKSVEETDWNQDDFVYTTNDNNNLDDKIKESISAITIITTNDDDNDDANDDNDDNDTNNVVEITVAKSNPMENIDENNISGKINDNDNNNDDCKLPSMHHQRRHRHYSNQEILVLRQVHGYCVHCKDPNRIPTKIYIYDKQKGSLSSLCRFRNVPGECANGICFYCFPEEQQEQEEQLLLQQQQQQQQQQAEREKEQNNHHHQQQEKKKQQQPLSNQNNDKEQFESIQECQDKQTQEQQEQEHTLAPPQGPQVAVPMGETFVGNIAKAHVVMASVSTNDSFDNDDDDDDDQTAETDISDENDEQLEFPKHGVTLSFLLEEFIEKDCGGRDKLVGLTTTDVCEQFIKPMTADYQSSYCDKLRRQEEQQLLQDESKDIDAKPCSKPRRFGEVASVFISHAHRYIFLEVISALAWHMRNERRDIVIWFDIFSINQHKPTQWTFEWLSSAFKSAIQSFGRTIMVLSPWYAPVPFTRLWCIYEAYSTLFTDSVFEIAMSANDQHQFLQDIREDPQRRINQMLGEIRAEKAECYLEKDRDNIFYVVQTSVGFGKINAMVFSKYRDWVLAVSIDAYEKSTDEYDKLDILSTIGSLYSGQGKNQQAEPYHKECYEKRKTLLGEDHPATLKALNLLAVHFTSIGRYNDGKILHEECLKRRKDTLGENHLSTLVSMDNLAFLHQCQGNFDLAQTLYDECLERRRTTLGSEHSLTIESLNNLASLHVVRAKYDLAKPLYEECLKHRKRSYGKTHPDTLTSIHNLARLFDLQGVFVKAQSLYEVCLMKRRTVLGESHPATISTLHNLVQLYYKQAKYVRVRPDCIDCLEKRKVSLGELHPDTLSTMALLAALYEHGGEKDQATIIYEQCLEKFHECLEEQKTLLLNEDHPKILDLKSTMTMLHSQLGQYDEAIVLGRHCLQTRTEILGPNHPDTLRSMAQLAKLYYKRGKNIHCNYYEQAFPLLVDCWDRRKMALGEHHPETLEAMYHLALWYVSSSSCCKDEKQQENYHDIAQSLFEECLQKRRDILGNYHMDTINTMNNLAVLYYQKQQQAERQQQEQQVEENDDDDTHNDDDNNKDTNNNDDDRNNNNNNNDSDDMKEKAKNLYEECLAKRQSLKGDFNPYPNQVHPEDIFGLLAAACYNED